MIALLLTAVALGASTRDPGQAARWRGTVGADCVPFGRADLAWVEGDELTGTEVALTDGMLSPPLFMHVGVTSSTDAVLAGLGLARVGSVTATYDADGNLLSTSGEHVMGLRLSGDYRRYLSPRVLPGSDDPPAVAPFLQVGVYGVIPSARRYDDAWTAEEQTAQDDAAGDERARIGAVGGRAGGGAAACWTSGLCVGMRGLVVLHRGQAVGDGFKTVSTLLTFEPALSLDLAF